jgi:hypothetical protein
MSPAETIAAPAFVIELRQKFTVIQNRYDVVRIDAAGTESALAYAEQKRFSLKEKVTFWSGTDKSTVAFTIAARNVLEVLGVYDVCSPAGDVIATIRKDAKASLMRSTYRVELPSGTVVTGAERGAVKAVLRRVVGFASDFPWPFPIHFDFTDQHGTTLLAVERQMKLRDVYRVPVADAGLDWRIAAALAVTVDSFMNR